MDPHCAAADNDVSPCDDDGSSSIRSVSPLSSEPDAPAIILEHTVPGGGRDRRATPAQISGLASIPELSAATFTVGDQALREDSRMDVRIPSNTSSLTVVQPESFGWAFWRTLSDEVQRSRTSVGTGLRPAYNVPPSPDLPDPGKIVAPLNAGAHERAARGDDDADRVGPHPHATDSPTGDLNQTSLGHSVYGLNEGGGGGHLTPRNNTAFSMTAGMTLDRELTAYGTDVVAIKTSQSSLPACRYAMMVVDASRTRYNWVNWDRLTIPVNLSEEFQSVLQKHKTRFPPTD